MCPFHVHFIIYFYFKFQVNLSKVVIVKIVIYGTLCEYISKYNDHYIALRRYCQWIYEIHKTHGTVQMCCMHPTNWFSYMSKLSKHTNSCDYITTPMMFSKCSENRMLSQKAYFIEKIVFLIT